MLISLKITYEPYPLRKFSDMDLERNNVIKIHDGMISISTRDCHMCISTHQVMSWYSEFWSSETTLERRVNLETDILT